MGRMNNETFVCVDCETTGLEPKQDRIIEIAAIQFTLDTELAQMDTLVDPKREIPEDSIKIHHITQDMVAGKPTIAQVLPQVIEFLGDHIIVGHGIKFDLEVIKAEADRHGIECPDYIKKGRFFDTLRMARPLWRLIE